MDSEVLRGTQVCKHLRTWFPPDKLGAWIGGIARAAMHMWAMVSTSLFSSRGDVSSTYAAKEN